MQKRLEDHEHCHSLPFFFFFKYFSEYLIRLLNIVDVAALNPLVHKDGFLLSIIFSVVFTNVSQCVHDDSPGGMSSFTSDGWRGWPLFKYCCIALD